MSWWLLAAGVLLWFAGYWVGRGDGRIATYHEETTGQLEKYKDRIGCDQ